MAARQSAQKRRSAGLLSSQSSFTNASGANGPLSSKAFKDTLATVPTEHSNSRPKRKFADLLRARRQALGLSRRSLAQQIGIRTSRLAVLENARRKPSLWLIARLSTVLQIDGKELLVLARPEAKPFLVPYPGTALNRSWRRLLSSNLLASYHVTRREREALECLAMLGGTVTRRTLVTILMLIRDLPRD